MVLWACGPSPARPEPLANKPALTEGNVIFGASCGRRQLRAVLNSEVPSANVKLNEVSWYTRSVARCRFPGRQFVDCRELRDCAALHPGLSIGLWFRTEDPEQQRWGCRDLVWIVNAVTLVNKWPVTRQAETEISSPVLTVLKSYLDKRKPYLFKRKLCIKEKNFI